MEMETGRMGRAAPRDRVLTLLRILYTETNEGHPMSYEELARRLREQGGTVDRKCFYRDISGFQRAGIVIRFRRGNDGGYWLEDFDERWRIKGGRVMNELRKCPFCGSEAAGEGSSISYWVECQNRGCGARILFRADSEYSAKDKATEAWNRRTKA